MPAPELDLLPLDLGPPPLDLGADSGMSGTPPLELAPLDLAPAPSALERPPALEAPGGTPGLLLDLGPAYPVGPGGGPANAGSKLDVFLGDLPRAQESPLAPLDLDLGLSDGVADPGLPLDLGLAPIQPAGAQPGPPPDGAPPLDLLDLAVGPASPPIKAAGDTPQAGAARAPTSAKPPKPPSSGAVQTLVAGGVTATASGTDLGFSLELESAGTPEAPPSTPAARSVAARPRPGDLPAGVPRLAPPRQKGTALVETAPERRGRRGLVIGLAVVGVLAASGVTAFFLLRPEGARPADVLRPFAAPLAQDTYPAYARATETLVATAGPETAPALRGAAAEHLLLAVVARGAERSRIARGEQILAPVRGLAPADSPAELRRARALLAVATGKFRDVEAALGTASESPETQVVLGLRRLAEGKPELAVAPLERAAHDGPRRALALYLLGQALESSGKTGDAAGAYRKLLAINPEHPGGLVAAARVSADPPDKRLAVAEAVLAKAKDAASVASPGDLAEALALAGASALALGRTAEAIDTLDRAVAAQPQNVRAQLAKAEALLADRRPADAVAALEAAGTPVLRQAAGRLVMGGALIAAGRRAEGLRLIEAAAGEAPQDPRGPHFRALAAETAAPPDPKAAEAGYRQALALNARFLPATLRLAALLQRLGRPEDSLLVLKQAEGAGAPAESLELAFGQALIAAKDHVRAEAVYRKVLEARPRLGVARVGLAAALEAGGDVAGAEAELRRTLTEAPETPGLRERLATLLVQRDKKADALDVLLAERATGRSAPTLGVTTAKLALELGRLDVAARELEAVVVEHPGTPEALFTLGRVREAAGNPQQALLEYRRALAFEQSPQLHLTFGQALSRAGKEDEAMSQLEAAGPLAAAQLERGRIRLRRGQLDQALADFEEAARLEPGDGQAHLLRGLVLDKLGQFDRAADAWRAAIRAAPDQAEAHYRLGRFEMDRGRAAAALPALRQAAARLPTGAGWDAELYFQLGYAEAAAGSRTNAASAFRRYLERAPKDAPARPEVEKKLAQLGR